MSKTLTACKAVGWTIGPGVGAGVGIGVNSTGGNGTGVVVGVSVTAGATTVASAEDGRACTGVDEKTLSPLFTLGVLEVLSKISLPIHANPPKTAIPQITKRVRFLLELFGGKWNPRIECCIAIGEITIK